MERGRAPWDSLWQELADVCHPRRNLITRQAADQTAPDRSKLAEAFDTTAQRANRTLAHGQFSRITPMGARWFATRPPDDVARFPAAQRWYQQCGEILARAFAKSNFYNRAHEHYLDRGAFGTAATEVTSGPGGRGLHFRAYPVGSFSIAHNARDEVDVICRTAGMTPAQILGLWPESAPESVHKKAAESATRHVPLEVVHLIHPRRDRDPRRQDPDNKPFESIHILKSERAILSRGGYDEFPVAVSRWELWGESPYGWAPSYHALPEATQANFLEQMLDTLAEIAVFPRVLYPSNIKGDVNFAALGLTCYDPSNGQTPKEWLTGGRYDIGKDRLNDKRRAIEEAFFVPLFSAISNLDRNSTATEIRAVIGETRELFHPIFANLTREFLRPVIVRSFALLLRQGELPPPPPAVVQQDALGAFIADPAVEYTSAMAMALEQSQLANFSDVVAVLAPFAQSNPEVFDSFNLAEIVLTFMRYKGLPQNFVHTPEEMAAKAEARAKAQQMAMAGEAAKAVGSLGGAPAIRDIAGMVDY